MSSIKELITTDLNRNILYFNSGKLLLNLNNLY